MGPDPPRLIVGSDSPHELVEPDPPHQLVRQDSPHELVHHTNSFVGLNQNKRLIRGQTSHSVWELQSRFDKKRMLQTDPLVPSSYHRQVPVGKNVVQRYQLENLHFFICLDLFCSESVCISPPPPFSFRICRTCKFLLAHCPPPKFWNLAHLPSPSCRATCFANSGDWVVSTLLVLVSLARWLNCDAVCSAWYHSRIV